jgi:glycosyltransferase involved in cell wall biosynthesis
LPNHCEDNIHEFIEEIERTVPCSEIIIACDRYSKGKGWAVRTALAQAKGSSIVFLDADGDIQPSELLRMLRFSESHEIVVGKKQLSKLSCRRIIISFLSRLFLRFLFGLQVETQTGVKIFKREALPEWEENGWLFDVEILWKAQQRGYRICEVPIECKITKSKSLGTLWKTFLESLSLWFRLSFRAGK